MENNTEIPQKNKNKIAIQPRNSTSGYLSKENKTLIQKNICTSTFITTLLTIAEIRKHPSARRQTVR